MPEPRRVNTDLSVIVPVYNEAERLPKTLTRLDQYLSAGSFSYEILVVLDGPTDQTRDVLTAMSGSIKHLKVIDRVVNRGKGFTVQRIHGARGHAKRGRTDSALH